MNEAIKRWIRPVLYPPLHAWQWFYDYSRAKLGDWDDYRKRREIQRDATMVLRDVHGIRFVLYPFDRPNLLNLVRRCYDVAEFQAVPRLARPGNIAIDVGANVGLYTVLLSRLCGPEGRVWAFEPVPETYWRLRETLALNRCENVFPVQAALCAESGSARMNLFEPQFAEWNSLGRPSMLGSNRKPITPHQSIEVPAFNLDRFCEAEGIERINFLKVDVEGFELAVFQGAKRLLEQQRVDYICFEISQAPLRGAGVTSREIFAALEAYGYGAYRFEVKTGAFQGPVRDTSEEWLNFFASWRDLSQSKELNLRARPQEKSIDGNQQ
ncbi:MAG: putative methyltransferase [Candidatus Acidoferrum typicum]|nr:putative methyltransferase [Candidatus Acidoferrum typicum]